MLSGKSTLVCVFSKVPEFLLVAFKLLEIHWAALFFAVLRFVKTWVFCIRFFSKTKRKTAKKMQPNVFLVI